MINKQQREKFLTKIFYIFLLLQPILDLYFLFDQKYSAKMSFSPSTIIRVVGLLLIATIAIKTKSIKFETNKKNLIIYAFLLVLYLVLSYFNASIFRVELPETYQYDFLKEIFYVIRMLIPLIVAFLTIYINLSEKNFHKILYAVSLMFSSVIILTNLLKISLSAYDSSNSTWASFNIVDWFTMKGDIVFKMAATKGLFVSANQISCLFLMILPILLVSYIKKPKKSKLAIIFLQILAMISMGTRVASQGWILALLFVVALTFFFNKEIENIKKKHFNSAPLFLLSIFLLIIFSMYGPSIYRSNVNTVIDYHFLIIGLFSIVLIYLFRKTIRFRNFNNSISKILIVGVVFLIILTIGPISYRNFSDSETNLADISKEKIENCTPEVLHENYEKLGLQAQYIKSIYPVEQDTYFWCDFVNLEPEDKVGNRNHQLAITSRISQLNANNLDKLIGIGYSRLTSGTLYIERDIVVHYYSIGILGILLFIMPYVIIALYSIVKILKYRSSNLTLENIIYVVSIFICLGVSTLSGHVLDELIVMIFLGLISGYLLKNIEKGDIDG